MTVWTSDIEAYRAPFLILEEAAAAAYNQFVYQDREQADAVRNLLLDRGVAEFTGRFGFAIVENGWLQGFSSALSAPDLRLCRMKSALAIAKAGLFDRDPGLYRRMQIAAEAGAKLEVGDFYISRVAVDPRFTGRGLGRLLLDRAQERAEASGAERLVLEVASHNEAALRLYRKYGFAEGECRRVADPLTGRSLALVEMARPV